MKRESEKILSGLYERLGDKLTDRQLDKILKKIDEIEGHSSPEDWIIKAAVGILLFLAAGLTLHALLGPIVSCLA